MAEVCYLFLVYLISCVTTSQAFTDNKVRRFPDGFLFGVASSSYQVEGGWDSDGKSPSIWDKAVHEDSEKIVDATNGDVACDSYNNYKRDVEMVRELGVDFYRFSISWSRVLPQGFDNIKNEPGLQYYDNVIDELIKYNIEPMVTMYHFDLPQRLQDLGGWANPLSIDWFMDYAKVLYDRYAHKVKYWITFNQPNEICTSGYGEGKMAPFVKIPGVADYVCIKNVLLAHAKAWRLYNTVYKSKYAGPGTSSAGFAVAINWMEPLNNSTENKKATEELREFMIDMYVKPIFSTEGGFPTVVKDIIKKKSQEQGFFRSRLPYLTDTEIRTIRGSADFLAINHYTTFLVERAKPGTHESPSFEDDVNVKLSFDKNWIRSKSPWLSSVPFGLYKTTLYLNQRYDYPPMFITENGWSSSAGLHDDDRVNNIREYLIALLFAMEDGTNVKGYTVWSLMDNFEWTAGYSERFGLYEVDFESEEKTRKARKSALVYKRIVSSRVIDKEWEPKSLEITVSKRRINMKAKTEL